MAIRHKILRAGVQMLSAACVCMAAAACSRGDGAPSADSAVEIDSSDIAGLAAQGIAEELPSEPRRIHINNIGELNKVFNDINETQLRHARRLGIDPIRNLAQTYFTKRPVIHIRDGEAYSLDTLTHSLPYLVPEAAQLLHDIGTAFTDSLESRGGGGYRIKVTSLLRTPATVASLRKVNVNASENSTHQYGTTFDISYTDFRRDPAAPEIEQEDLKNLLGEVLRDKREAGRCLVKFERATGCFHVTVCK